ncbi:Uncharacterized protein TCM_045588 [Theobroma cacao]|uniref:Uncharacterized protein n=1 Tax=Theobroma cacao TaxID=3641 RepID=A0A061FZK1_THECC|nr:Uncharacterized protein TCM_045588 [Theobroma cacao]
MCVSKYRLRLKYYIFIYMLSKLESSGVGFGYRGGEVHLEPSFLLSSHLKNCAQKLEFHYFMQLKHPNGFGWFLSLFKLALHLHADALHLQTPHAMH